MTGIESRHAGTLGGRLSELGARRLSVGIRVEEHAATLAATQHAAWMLVNLLARLEGVVAAIAIEVPPAPLAAPRLSPLAPRARDLRSALTEGIAALAPDLLGDEEPTRCDVLLTVGPGAAPERGWRLHGCGFAGALREGPIDSPAESELPFGPYLAACLAAGEVFRLARLPDAQYRLTSGLSYSLWDFRLGEGTLEDRPPRLPDPIRLDFGLAGVGAVGCAALHALWACPGLAGSGVLADGDPDGVEESNLNRCSIFGRSEIGCLKASAAARILSAAPIEWLPLDAPYARGALPMVPPVLLSAVDTNRSRIALQNGFWPARLLGASSLDLRAELSRLGPPGRGPCLCCHNPAEVDPPDDLRREQLRAMEDAELCALAERIGTAPEALRRWAREGGCGYVADAVLGALREDDEEPALFAVGFVSALAGTALAAELVKEFAGAPGPLDHTRQQVKFQFISPAVPNNGRPRGVRRDPACTACAPGGPGLEVWERRAAAWHPAGPPRHRVP